MTHITLRIYGSLQDFLKPARSGAFTEVALQVRGPQNLKHVLEALGIPHPEVARILHGGKPVPWTALPQAGATYAVHPYRPGEAWPGPGPPRFVLDGHLGRLAAYLRLLGFDTRYDPQWDDGTLARYAGEEARFLLTRDQGLLKRGRVRFGYWVRHLRPQEQLQEVVHYLQLGRWAKPFTRCARCNTPLQDVPKAQVRDMVPAYVFRHHTRFRRCPGCGRVYWEGTHVTRLRALFRRVLQGERADSPRA